MCAIDLRDLVGTPERGAADLHFVSSSCDGSHSNQSEGTPPPFFRAHFSVPQIHKQPIPEFVWRVDFLEAGKSIQNDDLPCRRQTAARPIQRPQLATPRTE